MVAYPYKWRRSPDEDTNNVLFNFVSMWYRMAIIK